MNLCPRSRCLIGYASSERSKAILDPQRELIDIHRSRRGCFDISAVSAPSGSSPSGGTQRYPFRAAKRMAHSNAVRLLPSGNAWLLATACNKTAVFVANSGYFSKSPKPALGAANAEPASVSLMTARTVARSVPRCPHRRVHRGNFGVTRLPRRESSRSASGAGSLPGGRTQGVGVLIVSGRGLETMPNAFLTPSRRGEHPISERQSIAIRCARWEPQTFGYLLPNWWARASRFGPAPDCSRKISSRDIETDNPGPQAGARAYSQGWFCRVFGTVHQRGKGRRGALHRRLRLQVMR